MISLFMCNWGNSVVGFFGSHFSAEICLLRCALSIKCLKKPLPGLKTNRS